MEWLNNLLGNERSHFFVGFFVFVLAVVVVIIIYSFITKKLTQRAARTSNKIDDFIIDVLRMPFLLLLIWIMILIFTRSSFFEVKYSLSINHILEILLIVTVSWILIKCIRVFFYFFEKKLEANEKNIYRERESLTKLTIFERMITVLIIIITIAVCLMTFDGIRTVGVGLLSSAGIASVIVGFAAQKSIGAVMAGIQIAITQPIKLDDLVVVDGLSGHIEEINLTYVVVKLVDEKRFILPINYFMENSFQNWTRSSSNILSTVYLYVDYNMPLEPLRNKLKEILQKNPNWDNRIENIQVTDMKKDYMELRVLLSSSNSDTSWKLQVEVREKLIEFIRDNYSNYFAKQRTTDEPETVSEEKNIDNL